ncbi:MAG: hypothetical protein HC871_12560 [Rhizobiales bacterium]|nr:hypothetical protein [Hyphomicrobiales bacterium]
MELQLLFVFGLDCLELLLQNAQTFLVVYFHPDEVVIVFSWLFLLSHNLDLLFLLLGFVLVAANDPPDALQDVIHGWLMRSIHRLSNLVARRVSQCGLDFSHKPGDLKALVCEYRRNNPQTRTPLFD